MDKNTENICQLRWVDAKKRPTVAIVGDLILDEYLEGSVARISPEAPVPVHLVSQSIKRAGGAANTALNVVGAGGAAKVFSVVGDDETATILIKILEDAGVDCSGVVRDPERATIRKTRITAARQQIVRLDWERPSPVSAAQESRLAQSIAYAEFDAIVVSDYGKGGVSRTYLQTIMDVCKKRNIPVFIDPKGSDYSRYEGAFLITPNRSEACQALGLDSADQHDHKALANQLRDQFNIQNVLVTLGADGMYLAAGKGADAVAKHLDALAREVFDVSGAGDTVVALMALCVAGGYDLVESMKIANVAASIVVTKWGTQPVYAEELSRALESGSAIGSPQNQLGPTKISDKILTRAELKNAVAEMRQTKRDLKLVFSNGCFDLLHAGHVRYLEKARALGDMLVVGVNADVSVKRLKGKTRPIVAEKYRSEVLAALASVNFVTVFDEDTPENLIRDLKPDILIKGADWAVDKIAGADFVKSYGGRVERIELVDGLSTSDIVKKIKSDS